jgi:branched-chain amino acid transport system ATP-binding protein
MAEAALLEIESAVSGYGGPDVLRGIGISIPRGNLVALIGPNGHGKTTLLRTISGLVPLTAGSIRFADKDISNWEPHKIAAAGIVHVPQGDLLFPDMTVAENLVMGGYLTSDRSALRQRLQEIYDLFPRLAERRGQIASTLSGGERRMAGIGRGLMMGGSMLMLDEPSLGLAPVAIEQIFAIIAALRASGKTVLLVEENPSRVANIADCIHLLDDGQIVWSGTASALLSRSELIETYLGG